MSSFSVGYYESDRRRGGGGGDAIDELEGLVEFESGSERGGKRRRMEVGDLEEELLGVGKVNFTPRFVSWGGRGRGRTSGWERGASSATRRTAATMGEVCADFSLGFLCFFA